MKHLDPLPLPDLANFSDLVFRPHPSRLGGHIQALHRIASGTVSVTRGGLNDGTTYEPYEMMTPDGETHAPLTQSMVSELLSALTHPPHTASSEPAGSSE
jgi:hypothetical protein